jgi:hypothetical protein
MSFAAVAVGVGALAGGVISAQGAKSAANTQASAQENAAAQQMQMFNTIQGQEQPFMQAGYGATTSLQQLLGLTSGNPGGGLSNGYLAGGMPTPQTVPTFNSSTVTNSPGYQFAQQQGLSQVANAEAPNVGAMSGPAMKALTNFASGTAAQYYNDYFNQANTQFNQGTTAFNEAQSNQNNIFSRLSAIAGLGQNAASNTGTAGTQLGTGAAQATAGAGASQAAGTVGAANSISGGIQGAANSYALSSILSQYGGAGGGGGGGTVGVPGWTPATGGA